MFHELFAFLLTVGISASAVAFLLFFQVYRMIRRMYPGRRTENDSLAERLRETDPMLFRYLRAGGVLLAAGAVCCAAGGVAALLS